MRQPRNKKTFLLPNEPFGVNFSLCSVLFPKAVPQLIAAAHIQLIDITPEEAQKLITQQVTTFDISTTIHDF
jgi:hypothetical protein